MFTLGTLGASTISAGNTTSFTIKPNDNLPAGTYTARVILSGDNGVSKTLDVSFTVSAAPTYIATLSESSPYTFAGETVGYASIPEKTVIITNGGTGNLTGLVVSLSGANPGDFTITQPSLTTLGSGGTATFTVRPHDGLSVGIYTATVTLTGSNSVSKSFNVSFDVTAAPVTPAINSVTVNPTTASVVQGQTKQLAVSVSAVGGAAQTVTWSSSDTNNKVKVDSNGLVSVASDATPEDYIITATSTFDSSKKGTATITVTTSAAVTYTLNYKAGKGGKIEGDSSQKVVEGNNGTKVTAVANTGYHFVGWSDGKTDASRKDTNVNEDINVSAEFELDLPSSTNTTPAGVRISGTEQVDNTLEAQLTDEDGVSVTTSAAVTYKWYRIPSSDSEDETLVGEGKTYKLVSDDIGKYIKLVATYIDETFKKITSKILGNSSNTNTNSSGGSTGSSGHSSSGSSSTASSTSSTQQITVKVTDGSSDNSISQTVIERTTASDGTKADTVTYTPDKAQEQE